MLNFEWYNPTRLIFGEGQISKLNNFISKDQKILLAYGGGSIFNNGVYQQVMDALSGYAIVEFGGIEANPHYETLMKAVELVREQKITYILAVGGGSVIDGVKFISAAVQFEGDPIDIIKNKMLIKENAVPFGTVLTLPATASEMNSGSVVTIAATQEKLSFGGEALFPQFSICDPTVIQSLPLRQIQNGLVDAFVHVLEQYLTFPQQAHLQDRIAEGILLTLIETAPKVLRDPRDYVAASNFMWCCTMALNGLISKGVVTDWATHAIGHELTALYHIDHARTLAIIGPNLYRVLFETKKQKLAQYGKNVWKLDQGSDEQIAEKAIEMTVQFFKETGMPTTISQCTDDYHTAVSFIVERFRDRNWTALGEKKNLDLEKLQGIIEKSL